MLPWQWTLSSHHMPTGLLGEQWPNAVSSHFESAVKQHDERAKVQRYNAFKGIERMQMTTDHAERERQRREIHTHRMPSLITANLQRGIGEPLFSPNR